MNDDHDKKITFILPSACFSSTYWTTATLSGNGFNSNLSLRFYPIPGTSSYSAETSANAWGIVKTGRFTNIIIRTNNYDPSWTASPGTSGTSGYNGYASGTPVVNTVFSNEPIATKNYVDSAIAGLMETSGLEYDGDKISGYMGSAFAGGGSTYSAGANINITDDVISGKDWSEEIPDIIQLSAGPNIDIYSANNTVFISAAAGGGGVPQSAFDAATAKIEQLESILSAYSGQWLLA